MMKRRPSVLVAFATLLVALFVALATAASAQAEYTYTIRVFPGNRGTLPNDPVVIPVVDNSQPIDLYAEAPVEITDSKYVQTGYRLSGTDKLYGNGVVPAGIQEDMDFVVAYGVKANTVPYTIKYVEYQTGKELAEPKTYYGTVGDKPVASYEYIEGYRPRYLAITGTLQADEENVWTFEYIPLEEGETVVVTTTTTETTVVTTPGPTTTNTTVVGGGETTTTTGGGTAATTEGGAAATTEGGAAATTEGGAATTEGGEATEGAAPATQEILDLDTPLAGPSAANAGKKVGNDASLLTSPAFIAALAVIAAAAAGLIIYLTKIKKDKVNEEA